MHPPADLCVYLLGAPRIEHQGGVLAVRSLQTRLFSAGVKYFETNCCRIPRVNGLRGRIPPWRLPVDV